MVRLKISKFLLLLFSNKNTWWLNTTFSDIKLLSHIKLLLHIKITFYYSFYLKKRMNCFLLEVHSNQQTIVIQNVVVLRNH